MTTVMATFGGFPTVMKLWHMALRSGLTRVATKEGM